MNLDVLVHLEEKIERLLRLKDQLEGQTRQLQEEKAQLVAERSQMLQELDRLLLKFDFLDQENR
ncbi:MAG: cell division protein ZapB [Desulfuromonadaceae bacterium]|nr:cell division protein ZapB [Desulfuromonadaceae bacterium]